MLKLGYLGPEGTFSHEAAEIWSKGQYELEALWSITAVLQALQDGKVARAMVPVENMLGGEVGETVDHLIVNTKSNGNLKITGELLLPIKHMLLSKGKVELEKIKQVVSHPQALAQCHIFLHQHKFELVETASTARAAEIIATSQDPEIATIASLKAAKEYQLEVIVSDIGDNKDNVTRFIFLGGPTPLPSGNDKTTIFFITEDEAGALYKALGVFYYGNVNLSKISSRPSKKKLGEYIFWVDAEGHEMDKDRVLKNTITDLKTRFSKELWVAGSYPEAQP